MADHPSGLIGHDTAFAQEGPASFLRLPYDVRHRIYDLVIPDPYQLIDLGNLSRNKKEPSGLHRRRNENDYKRFAWVSPVLDALQLVRTSRLISNEVTELFYGQHEFCIWYEASGALDVLERFRPSTLSHLRQLSLMLNHGTSPGHPCCGRKWLDDPGKMWDQPIPGSCFEDNLIKSQGACLILEWYYLANLLAKNITPWRMKLQLICDCLEIAAAKDLCEPFKKLQLEECSIRLAHYVDRSFQVLARDTALRSTGKRGDGQFRFMDLPYELRVQILELTDLVAPRKQLDWNNGCSPETHSNGCRVHSTISPLKAQGHHQDRVFCHLYYSAYTKHCKCWTLPSALFRVSRLMRDHACQIFFSRNRFNIARSLDGVISFFNWVLAMSSIQHLRAVHVLSKHILFPHRNVDTHTPWTLHRWQETFDRMAPHLQGKHLIMVTNMRLNSQFRLKPNAGSGSVDLPLSKWQVPLTLLSPLPTEQYFKDCFVHIDYPWRWRTKPRKMSDEMTKSFDRLESIIEQQIMGIEYDSKASGKSTRLQWRREVRGQMLEAFAPRPRRP